MTFFRLSNYFLWSNDFVNQQRFVSNSLWLIACHWWAGIFVNKFRHFSETIVMCRSVTRLDAHGGKNQVWRRRAPMYELEVFRKQMHCIEKSAYGTVVTFWLPAVIRCPGNCAPLSPSLRLWCYAVKIRKFSENKQILNPIVMNFYFKNICNFRPQYSMDLAQTANKGCWRRFRFPRVVFGSLLCLPHAFLAWSCVCFASNKTFPTFNKLLF